MEEKKPLINDFGIDFSKLTKGTKFKIEFKRWAGEDYSPPLVHIYKACNDINSMFLCGKSVCLQGFLVEYDSRIADKWEKSKGITALYFDNVIEII
jgi:hypothetical protein